MEREGGVAGGQGRGSLSREGFHGPREEHGEQHENEHNERHLFNDRTTRKHVNSASVPRSGGNTRKFRSHIWVRRCFGCKAPKKRFANGTMCAYMMGSSMSTIVKICGITSAADGLAAADAGADAL